MNWFRVGVFLLFGILPWTVSGQQIELFQQFNGRYDYVSVGNTLNLEENAGGSNCDILTSSSADFSLLANQQLVAAYLYWAGSGPGDFDVTLNNIPVTAERTFRYDLPGTNNTFFGASADVTTILEQLVTTRTFTVAELDLQNDIGPYCTANGGTGTNFGGWAITVIFEDASLPLNQVNIFDGFETVSGASPVIVIELQNLNVLDNTGAKIGFLAWEGDAGLANNETISINGNVLSNPPLNPANNAFNGTNSFTESTELYNMDMDFYDIQNNIQPGDNSATIRLTSNQDLVIINNIVTVLNTELPDATIQATLAGGGTDCGDRDIDIDYTVFNVNSTRPLPAATPIAFYADTTLIGQSQTNTELPIGGSESGSITLTVPAGIPPEFTLRAVIDDDGTGNGIVFENNENNNDDTFDIRLLIFPEVTGLIDLEECDIVGIEIFDLTQATAQIDPDLTLSFHEERIDAINNTMPIDEPTEFENSQNPQTIWIRVANPDCFVVESFQIEVVFCPYPDATISVEEQINACRQRETQIDYTIFNTNGRGVLPSGTPIAFYADDELVAQSETLNDIPINGRESNTVEILFPGFVSEVFTLRAKVDDVGDGTGVVLELDEDNNENEVRVGFVTIEPIVELPNLLQCDEGFERAIFDLTQLNDLISTEPGDEISYYLSDADAIARENPISDPGAFENMTNPQFLYVRLENAICFQTSLFQVATEKCAPFIPEGFSPNGDTINDVFEISGIQDIFLDYNLKVYSRLGNLIFEGGNQDGFWDGVPNTGLLHGQGVVPTGTYYYVLQLNDPAFPKPFLNYIYVNY